MLDTADEILVRAAIRDASGRYALGERSATSVAETAAFDRIIKQNKALTLAALNAKIILVSVRENIERMVSPAVMRDDVYNFVSASVNELDDATKGVDHA